MTSPSRARLGIVWMTLTTASTGAANNFSTTNVQPASFWRRFGTHVGVAVAAATFAGSVMWSLRSDTPPPSVSRLQISPPTAAGLTVNSTNRHIAITSDGRLVCVANATSRTLTLIDAAALAVITHIDVGDTPAGVAVGPRSGGGR